MNYIQLPNERRQTRQTQSPSKSCMKSERVIHGPDGPLILGFDSGQENNGSAVVLSLPNVVSYWDQPPAIKFICSKTGKPRTKQPDGLVEFWDGYKAVLEFKDPRKANCPRFLDEMEALSEQIPPDYADELCVISSDSYEGYEATNALRLLEYKRDQDAEADQMVADFASNLDGLISVSDIVQILQLEGRGFPAIFRGIYSGVLQQVENGIIDLSTIVESGDKA
jgi:hypothetical protein